MNCHSISIASLSSTVNEQTSKHTEKRKNPGGAYLKWSLISYLVCLSPAGRWLHGSIRVQVGCHVNRADPLASLPTWTRVCSRRSCRYKPASPAVLEQPEKWISFTDNGQPWPSLFSLDQRAGPKARSRLWTILQEPSCRYILNDYSNVDVPFHYVFLLRGTLRQSWDEAHVGWTQFVGYWNAELQKRHCWQRCSRIILSSSSTELCQTGALSIG